MEGESSFLLDRRTFFRDIIEERRGRRGFLSEGTRRVRAELGRVRIMSRHENVRRLSHEMDIEVAFNTLVIGPQRDGVSNEPFRKGQPRY